MAFNKDNYLNRITVTARLRQAYKGLGNNNLCQW